jgi:dTDP-D-glucose 4,6-dehydratase
MQNGTAFGVLGLASNRKFKKQDGTQGEEVCFIDVKIFGRTAEIANQFLKKGSKICIEGKLTYESWEDNQIFNCSGEYEESNISICNKIAEIYFGHCNFLEGDLYDFSYSRPGQDIRYSLNCEKLKSKGWKPKTPENFPEMLEQTIRQKG